MFRYNHLKLGLYIWQAVLQIELECHSLRYTVSNVTAKNWSKLFMTSGIIKSPRIFYTHLCSECIHPYWFSLWLGKNTRKGYFSRAPSQWICHPSFCFKSFESTNSKASKSCNDPVWMLWHGSGFVLWRVRWPARPYTPTASGTQDLYWPVLWPMQPTPHMLVPTWTLRICLWMAGSMRTTLGQWQITTSWAWRPNVSPWTCQFRSLSLCMLMPSCICFSTGITCWVCTYSGSLFTQTLIATTYPWAQTAFTTASAPSTTMPSMSAPIISLVLFLFLSRKLPSICLEAGIISRRAGNNTENTTSGVPVAGNSVTCPGKNRDGRIQSVIQLCDSSPTVPRECKRNAGHGTANVNVDNRKYRHFRWEITQIWRTFTRTSGLSVVQLALWHARSSHYSKSPEFYDWHQSKYTVMATYILQCIAI